MKYNCKVIQDLLPLYTDGICSDVSAQMVEEHLKECASCEKIAKELQDDSVEKTLGKECDHVVLSHEKKVSKKMVTAGSITAAVLLIPVIVCLICNLAIGHALDWFFIVLTALLVVASVTEGEKVKKRIRCCVFILIFGVLVLQQTVVSAAEQILPSGISFDEIGSKMQAFEKKHADTTAGLAVSVFTSKEDVTQYAGYTDMEKKIKTDEMSVFEWGSTTKLLVFLSVMQQLEQNNLDLDTDIRTYLPKDFFKNLTFAEPVTMTELMNHTAGFQEEYVGLYEKGITAYPSLKEALYEHDPKASSSIVLAYIGDCVFDLIIKMRVVGRGGRQVHKLHEETSRYVQASAQSFMMRAIQEHLTEEEHAVYRRGRNTRSVSAAKNQSITDYRRATGFEALVGYLYLKKEYKRLVELVTIGLESMEKELENGEKND